MDEQLFSSRTLVSEVLRGVRGARRENGKEKNRRRMTITRQTDRKKEWELCVGSGEKDVRDDPVKRYGEVSKQHLHHSNLQ